MAVAQALRALLAEGRFQDALERYRELGSAPDSRWPDVQLLAATAATRLGDLDRATTLAVESLVQFRTRGDSDGRMRDRRAAISRTVPLGASSLASEA